VETGIVRDGHLLDIAALCGNVKIFNELIAHGAHDTRLMARLLELGVDINEPDDKGKLKNGSLGAPIFWAIRESRISNMKFLIGNGADLTVKAPYGGGTPLERARKRGYTEIAEYLESLSLLPQPGEFEADVRRKRAMEQALQESQVELNPWDASRQKAYEGQLLLLEQQNKMKMRFAREEQHRTSRDGAGG
jgi:hypothetical protein